MRTQPCEYRLLLIIRHLYSGTLYDCNIHRQYINSVPPLSPYLKRLYCRYTNVSILPELPATLKILCCHNNELSTLPAFPKGLTDLCCSHNRLTTLPPSLSDTIITRLNCSHNKIDSLPIELPATLIELDCSFNCLTILPKLPSTLEELKCETNNLSIIPELPPNLKLFWCNHNPRLSCLPDLPDSLRIMTLSWGNPMIKKRYPRLAYIESRERNSTVRVIEYVNEINSMWRTIDRCSLLQAGIIESYVRKTMHPHNLQPLLDNPELDVNTFMESLAMLL